MIRFEMVITAWEDGLHRGMKRFEFEGNGDFYMGEVAEAIDELKKNIAERKAKWQKIMEDDDIPF